MRFIKLGVISIVVFSLILTGFSLLLPSSINVSRTLDINAPSDHLYQQVYDLNNWKNWYVNPDSTAAVISNPSTGKGATIKTAKTEIEITGTTGSTIKINWKTKGDELPGEFNFINNDQSSVTTVQWKIVHKVKWYPWEKFASIVSDKAIGTFMEQSLDQLKKHVEKQ